MTAIDDWGFRRCQSISLPDIRLPSGLTDIFDPAPMKQKLLQI